MKKTKKINNEMVSFLQKYLRVDTSQPTPDYKQACTLLKVQAQSDGFLVQEIILPSGNPVVIITYEGTHPTLPTLALNHHMDVVPAPNIHNWTSPPFSGDIKHNTIIGRGIQDMKGIGVTHYFALKELKDAGIKPKRTIHLLAVPDEEVGGFKGTKEFVETDIFKKLNIGYVIDEGRASGNAKKINLKVADRKPLQIHLTSKGSLVHGSKLQCHNAIHELIQMLHHIVDHHQEQQQKTATTPAGLLLSMNITSFQAGIFNQGKTAINVVPNIATATVDIRIPPTMKIKDIKQMIEDIIVQFPNVNYTIEATVNERTFDQKYETPLYKALAKTITQYNMEPIPLYGEGASDLRYYLERGIQGIGITPFTAKDNVHGTNESLPIDDFVQGKDIIAQFIKNFCVEIQPDIEEHQTKSKKME